ncbi:MAG: hypothetical protein ACLTVB_04810, partial [Sutterella sp.]
DLETLLNIDIENNSYKRKVMKGFSRQSYSLSQLSLGWQSHCLARCGRNKIWSKNLLLSQRACRLKPIHEKAMCFSLKTTLMV